MKTSLRRSICLRLCTIATLSRKHAAPRAQYSAQCSERLNKSFSTFRSTATVSRLVEAMEAARTRDSELVPSHGNFRPECVIATPRGMVFVDWGRFQWADPCRDLAS